MTNVLLIALLVVTLIGNPQAKALLLQLLSMVGIKVGQSDTEPVFTDIVNDWDTLRSKVKSSELKAKLDELLPLINKERIDG